MTPAPDATPPKERTFDQRRLINALGIALALCAAIIIGLVASSRANAGQAGAATTSAEQLGRAGEGIDAHIHEWETIYKTIRHEAMTDTVHHPAEYSVQTIYHTVCTTCGEKVDNAIDEHEEATGHAGYSTNVPFEESALVKAAHDEAVVVSDAWTEETYDRSICKHCGAVSVLLADNEEENTLDPTPAS